MSGGRNKWNNQISCIPDLSSTTMHNSYKRDRGEIRYPQSQKVSNKFQDEEPKTNFQKTYRKNVNSTSDFYMTIIVN